MTSKIENKVYFSRYKTYAKGVIYHIYNRGNNKQKIFLEESDYRFYLDRLKKYIKKHNVLLINYVLLSNHIHLIIKQRSKVPISQFISSLHTSYSMYFNKKYNRVGHLFQNRFKQVIVVSNEQLLQLMLYVHLNPVRHGLVEKTENYLWSSYLEYVGVTTDQICDKKLIMELLNSTPTDFPAKYKVFLEDGSVNSNSADILEELVIEA